MTINLDINQEMELRLSQAAARRGQETEVFLQQLLREAIEQVLPSPVAISPRIAGLNAGQIWISDDFDAPLPDIFWTGEQNNMADEAASQ
jgi:hypothetical protein